MNIYTDTNSPFPSQVVSDAEKASLEYGEQVAQAIEQEWFSQGRVSGNRYLTNWNNFHQLRLYARGEQSIQKYKDELAINGDLSYLNLDWKPVPILSKFVDIVVNGISSKSYDIKAYAQDPESIKKRTEYASKIYEDMLSKEYLENLKQTLGLDLYQSPSKDIIPENREELELHMQLSYKQSVEIAEEEAISSVFAQNKYDLIRRRLNMDLVTCGIAAAKTSFNVANGVTVDYVDPAYMIYSYTEDPNFEDIYYVGEIKAITIPELKKEFPHISEEELKRIQAQPGNRSYITGWGDYDANTVQVLYFDYKTYHNQVFKIKQTDQGLIKAIEKPDTFNPEPNENFERVGRSIEVLYSGAKVLGTNTMLKWELAQNMSRPFADTTKVKMNYAICAPRMYKGRIESIVSKCTGFADMIQLTHLKLQQVISRMVPDGVYLDMDGLSEVDLGNGTNYNPAEALNMYFQTGSIVGRSLTQEGDMNPGKVPIQELQSGSGNAKISSLIQTYQYYLQMIRDVTGLNEARDGSLPDRNTLVGLQKLAANASNVATRHIVQSSLFLTLKLAENISLKVADALEFPLTKSSLQNSISTYNIKTLEEVVNLNLHDFGIFLELEPDEEEKQQLESNIQIALQAKNIDVEDAIDLRSIKNLKLANQMLKVKRKEKAKQDQAAQQANIAAQSQAQAAAAEKTAMAEVQKQQAISGANVEYEKAKSQFEIERMQIQAQLKKQEMQMQHQFDMQLKQVEEEQAQLEQNIQVALQAGGIDLEDAIDLRQIRNLKLANQMLKVKRRQKAKQDQANQQANIQAQAQAQAETAEKTAMAEVQKQQAISGANVEYEKAKSEFEKDRMQLQSQLDQQKMMQQHKNDMELKQLEVQQQQQKEKEIEDRKDKRIKMEGTQQSKMIQQRQTDSPAIDFEAESGLDMSPFM